MLQLKSFLWAFLILFFPVPTKADHGHPSGNTFKLSFLENKGQITDQHGSKRDDIYHKLEAGELTVFIGCGSIYYQWRQAAKTRPATAGEPTLQHAANPANAALIQFYRLDVALLNCNKNVKPVAEYEQPDFETYYSGAGGNGVTAHSFTKVTYPGIYPNIDWVLYIRNNTLKYDFIVHPGGRYSDIKLQYNGATGLELDNGNLTATTPMGKITEEAPYCYNKDTKKSISSSYRLDGNILSFEVEKGPGTTVIDPGIAWGTYYGGTLDEENSFAATDHSGNVYLTGSTSSTNNIATSGSHQSTASFGRDGFIAKFNAKGQRLWATYYGDINDDYILAALCDNEDNILVTGYTNSVSGIASPGAHQTTHGGAKDAFLAKFSSSGQRLWGTYYGGSNDDIGKAMTVDTANNIYLAGETFSSSGIATSGSHQPAYGGNGNEDGFIAKFTSAGVRQWSTYYGGIIEDAFWGIVADTFGYIYACGNSSSPSGISTPGSFQPARNGFSTDNMVVKFSQAGSRIWGTYYGGSYSDVATAITTDNNGAIYVTGGTSSTDWAIALPAHQSSNAGSVDGFLYKMDVSGNLLWSTYYGGSSVDEPNTISYHHSGKVMISGSTQSSNNIATPGAYKTSINAHDMFFATFNTGGPRIYGSYFGGLLGELGSSVFDLSGNIYLHGRTSSSTGISTTGAHQAAHTSPGVAWECFLARFNADTFINITMATPSTVCPSDTLRVFYTTNTKLQSANTFKVELSDSSGSFVNPVTIGTISADTSGSILCTISQPIVSNYYRVRVVSSSPYYISDPSGIIIRHKQPLVTVSAVPSVIYVFGTPVTLTATPVNGGTSPVFKWFLNGKELAGVNTNQYLTDSLSPGDVVRAWLQSSDPCTNPDTAVYDMPPVRYADHVSTLAGTPNAFLIYPNPASSVINLRCLAAGSSQEGFEFRLYNAIGQLVYQQNFVLNDPSQVHRISINDNIPNGLYHAVLKAGNKPYHAKLHIHR